MHMLLSPLLAGAIGLRLLTPGASMAVELQMPAPAQQVHKLQDIPSCAAAGSSYSGCGTVLLQTMHYRSCAHSVDNLLLPLLQAVAQVAVSAQPAAELAMQYAPDLVDESDGPVTDLEVEMADSRTAGNMLVNGLEWMMEEGLEVTNFTESNFAAVG
jgi:hypothetical protein